ncbi:MAG: hypothetical protein IJC71_00985 [Clostridia bacterium]|nr:hypothetical protein [Clostridia bacterium]
MKNLEPRNGAGEQTDLSAAMTPEELRLYREILESAYPKPKRDIRAGVMEVIRAEAAAAAAGTAVAGEAVRESKVLEPKRSRQKAGRRDLFVKWGSLAACIVLVSAIGIRILPSFLTKDAVAYDSAYAGDTALQEAYSTADQSAGQSAAETSAETQAGEGAAGVMYKSMLTGSPASNSVVAEETEAAADTPAEEVEECAEDISAQSVLYTYTADLDDEAVTEDAAEAEAVMEEAMPAPVVEEEPVSEEAAVEEPAAEFIAEEAVKAEAAPHVCLHTEVFRGSYHEIPDELIDQIGWKEYNAWVKEAGKDDPCAVNIHSFLEHFAVSRTTFAMYLANTDLSYFCDYPLDVLYGKSEEEIERYYRNGGDAEGMTADYFEYTLKCALIDEIGEEAYAVWLDDFTHETVRAWSISQFVRDHGLTEAQFLEVYDDAADAFREEYEDVLVHGYDTTMLFVPNMAVQRAIAMSGSGYAADVLCRK